MAILDSNNFGWVVCHETFINEVYRRTRVGQEPRSYAVNPVLFEIVEPFKNNKNEKTDGGDKEITLIRKAYESLYELHKGSKGSLIEDGEDADDREQGSRSNSDARNVAKEFYSKSLDYPTKQFWGGNEDVEAVVEQVENEKYLFPERCSFYSCDIKNIGSHLREKCFHFILMDPPWWNKFIRRKRKADASSGYTMLYDTDLISIPINELLDGDGIIGIWCTSAPSHINAILNKLFPAWDIKYVSQWFWLKVTKSGKPTCAFSHSLQKQPYERIIFGVKKGSNRTLPNPEDNKVIMSVPSAIHSHKPPICELIKPCLPDNSDCLELFARYLLPKWTSYGNEVLKLQHLSLYNHVTVLSNEEK